MPRFFARVRPLRNAPHVQRMDLPGRQAGQEARRGSGQLVRRLKSAPSHPAFQTSGSNRPLPFRGCLDTSEQGFLRFCRVFRGTSESAKTPGNPGVSRLFTGVGVSFDSQSEDRCSIQLSYGRMAESIRVILAPLWTRTRRRTGPARPLGRPAFRHIAVSLTVETPCTPCGRPTPGRRSGRGFRPRAGHPQGGQASAIPWIADGFPLPTS
jgi:hypothetical protein